MRSIEDSVSEFVLSQDDKNVVVENDTGQIGEWRWMPVTQSGAQYLALNILSGEAFVSPRLHIAHDLFLRFHIAQSLSTLSDDGLVAEIFFRSKKGARERVLLEIPMKPGENNEVSATLDLRQLDGCSGRLGIRCKPGPLGDPRGDWLAILRFIVGHEHRLGLLNGRANRAWRIKNEIAHFDTHYDHAIYAKRLVDEKNTSGHSDSTPPGLDSDFSDIEAPSITEPDLAAADVYEQSEAQVRPEDDVFHYSVRLLSSLIGDEHSIDFAERLRLLAPAQRPLRFLTLCSGAAGIERGLFEKAGIPAEITLYDINETLMDRALTSLSPFGRVRKMLGDVNEISVSQFPRKFDVVACVSGLHHVVELERVMETISQLLTEDGEFWMIGEQIGRNGNRLWPEAAQVANRLFADLPESLRKNSYTGKIDPVIPDVDFSASCFEGIRSSEIELTIQSYFEPVQLLRHNCFMWRLFEHTYFANYDIKDEAHRRIVIDFVVAEYNLWKKGGRPTTSNGVFRRRRVARG
jgi:SAM-dependent methyltransferase